MPYGNKEKDQIRMWTEENSFFLLKKRIKLLIIACHTASCFLKDSFKKEFPIPLIEMTEPSLTSISQEQKKIALLGTFNTISSKIYERAIYQRFPKVELFPTACPLLAELIEQGPVPALEESAHEYLDPLKGNVDSALYLCTHYPLIEPILKKAIGDNVTFLNPAKTCKNFVEKLLVKNLSPTKGSLLFFSSCGSKKFTEKAKSCFFSLS